jgi:hypothetical protein
MSGKEKRQRAAFVLWLTGLAAGTVLCAAGALLTGRAAVNACFVRQAEQGDGRAGLERTLLTMNWNEGYIPYYNLGNLEAAKGQWEKAALLYESALGKGAAHPAECRVRINLALSLVHEVDTDRAEAAADRLEARKKETEEQAEKSSLQINAEDSKEVEDEKEQVEDSGMVNHEDAKEEEQEDRRTVQTALVQLYAARNVLTEEACADAGWTEPGQTADPSSFHSTDAEKLKEEIDEEIRKLDPDAGKGETNNPDQDQSDGQDQEKDDSEKRSASQREKELSQQLRRQQSTAQQEHNETLGQQTLRDAGTENGGAESTADTGAYRGKNW